MNDLREELLRKIKVLNEQVWESRARIPQVDQWLDNFSGLHADMETERLQALFLLSQFMYFGSKEIRELLRCLYRDEFRYPVIKEIREQAADTTDEVFIQAAFDTELRSTRFLGVGNPAESGTHLLYFFRQENGLHKELFINSHEIFDYDPKGILLRDPSISRYVFIDDLAGSGVQATQYSERIVKIIKALNPAIKVSYHVMFATSDALRGIRINTAFDAVTAVFELDESFRCFSGASRYFAANAPFDRLEVEKLAVFYGNLVYSAFPLGYKNGQLLLGFHHNTPDNTLPLFWSDDSGHAWEAIFRRYPKIEW